MSYVTDKSRLLRKKWMLEGALEAAKMSFWTGYTGSSSDAVFHQIQLGDNGLVAIMEADGVLVDGAVADREQATGKGEHKRKFSSRIDCRRWRHVVDNGDKFDAIEIADIKLSEHSHSRNLLSNKLISHKDQAIYDTLMGNIGRPNGTHGPNTMAYSGAPTHLYEFGGATADGTQAYPTEASSAYDSEHMFSPNKTIIPTFGYEQLSDLCTSLATGHKFDGDNISAYRHNGNPDRIPLEPYSVSDGRPSWALVINDSVKNLLVKSDIFTKYAQDADMRGQNNMVFKGVLDRFQDVMIVNAPTFFGDPRDLSRGPTKASQFSSVYRPGASLKDTVGGVDDRDAVIGKNGTWQLNDYSVRRAGLRMMAYHTGADAVQDGFQLRQNTWYWQGNPGYVECLKKREAQLWVRCLLLGKNALQIAWAKSPEYLFQRSDDFGITSESGVEYWMNLQKTKYSPELGGDYTDASVTNMDWGVIPVDIRVK